MKKKRLENTDLKKCSKGIQTAVIIIEQNLANKKTEIIKEVRELQQKLKNRKKNTSKKHSYEFRLRSLNEDFSKPDFIDSDAEAVLVLSQFNPEYKEKFLKCSQENGFKYFSGSTEDPEIYRHLHELGVDISSDLKDIEQNVLGDGRITFNEDENVGLLNLYSFLQPRSKITKNAVQYYLKNYKEIIHDKYIDLSIVSHGLEVLLNLDPKKYTKEIEYHKNYLIQHQNSNGSINKRNFPDIETSHSLLVLSRILDSNNPVLIQGKNYLENLLTKKQTYKQLSTHRLALIVRALIALGYGPVNPAHQLAVQLYDIKSQLLYSKPFFIETSPDKNIQTLRDKIIEMIEGAQKEILISSPYVDMYSELSGKARKNSKLKVLILTRQLDEFKGERKRFAKTAFDILKKLPNTSIRVLDIIHARMIIVDGSKILISSADLTREQLLEEFNSGIYTEDPQATSDSRAFFMGAFNIAKKIQK